MRAVSVSMGANGTLDVALRGEIDFTNAAEVREIIRTAVAGERPAAVRADLADVTFVDSSGIGVLVSAMKAAEETGATYRVEHPNVKVHHQLRVAGLLDAFGLAEPPSED